MLLLIGRFFLYCLLFLSVLCDGSPFLSSLKELFEERFQSSCSRYKFIEKYQQLLMNEKVDKYLIFVFQDDQKTGGLGDRLAGLISALSLAIADERILLIKDSSGLEQFFTPFSFHKQNTSLSKSIFLNNIHERIPKFDKSWLEDETKTLELSCLNDKSPHCSMEDGIDSTKRFIIYRSNRCFLCKYSKITKFQNSLGINHEQDLYIIAGCLLRLILWPREEMWQHVHQEYKSQIKSIDLDESSTKDHVIHQVAIHYRCGDFNYVNDTHQTRCYNTIGNPTELGQCARNYLIQRHRHHHLLQGKEVLFLTSDHPPAIDKMLQVINTSSNPHLPHIYISPSGCHVGKDKSQSCLSMTIVYWFMMSLSERFVTQTSEKLSSPFSAYSRYAGLYSLHPHPFIMGSHCLLSSESGTTKSELNWYC